MNIKTDLINSFVKSKHGEDVYQIMGVFNGTDNGTRFLLLGENNEFSTEFVHQFSYLPEIPKNSLQACREDEKDEEDGKTLLKGWVYDDTNGYWTD